MTEQKLYSFSAISSIHPCRIKKPAERKRSFGVAYGYVFAAKLWMMLRRGQR